MTGYLLLTQKIEAERYAFESGNTRGRANFSRSACTARVGFVDRVPIDRLMKKLPLKPPRAIKGRCILHAEQPHSIFARGVSWGAKCMHAVNARSLMREPINTR